METFTAKYKSKSIKKQKYSEKSKVHLEIIPPEGSSYGKKDFDFTVSKGKKMIVLDDVNFEMVK